MTIEIVFYSGSGHARRVAEKVAKGAGAGLIGIDENGNIKDSEWQRLSSAGAIIFGAPTYMGSVPWQFKKFADASSTAWADGAWRDKLFAGFSCSASLNGDKQVTLQYLQTLASRHGGIWISLGLPPAHTSASTRDDINHLGGSAGLLVQSPSDADAEQIPAGDLATAVKFGERVAAIAARFN